MLKYFNILIVLIVLNIVIVQSSDLEAKKVHLVDVSTNPLPNGNINYLFRGNEPKQTLSNGTVVFAYDELTDYLRNSSESVGVTLPLNFYIFDIKLVTGPLPSEMPDIDLENNFFAANPELGEFAMNQTVGDILDPFFISDSEVVRLAKTLPNWQKDNLPQRMREIHNMLNGFENDLPVVIYIHCECGCDRTGEIFASYVMRFKGMNIEEALLWDNSIAGRAIEPPSRWAAEWYCYYLVYVENFQIDCTYSGPVFP